MKNEYSVMPITKSMCEPLLREYHYLAKESKGFKSGVNIGLFHREKIVGCCIFTGFPVPELAVGLFGLNRNEQEGLLELSRLVLLPQNQNSEHNLASWFIAKAIKLMRSHVKCRAILSYADTRFHAGTVYRAANFKYYGLTAAKKDWYVNGVKSSRGKSGNGQWLPRPQKHRFLMVFDKKLQVRWSECHV
jgi:hypothetical protein